MTDFLLLVTLILICCSAFSSAQNSGGGGSGVTVELWCVAKNNAADAALQTAIDWACGPGGADCGPIQQGGPCYDPSDIQKTASYAFNDYFLKHGMTEDSCSFDNTAALTSLNPSHGSCKFKSSTGATGSGNITGAAATGLGPNAGGLDSSSSVAQGWNWAFMAIPLISMVLS